jgi:hypothetical protein
MGGDGIAGANSVLFRQLGGLDSNGCSPDPPDIAQSPWSGRPNESHRCITDDNENVTYLWYFDVLRDGTQGRRHLEGKGNAIWQAQLDLHLGYEPVIPRTRGSQTIS